MKDASQSSVRFNRRALLAALCVCAASTPVYGKSQRAGRRFRGQWRKYKQRFLADDGRITDTFNDGICHTEGQGFGMLMAVSCGDQGTFEKIWRWTQSNLQREDNLFSWKWDPTASDPVADRNNATDGDILIAWALLRAGKLWGRRELIVESAFVLDAIEQKLVRDVGGLTVLLPGAEHLRPADHHD